MEIEMAVRNGRIRIGQFHAQFSLSDAIALIANRNMWPFLSEFKPFTYKGGKGKGNPPGYTKDQMANQERNRLKRDIGVWNTWVGVIISGFEYNLGEQGYTEWNMP